MTPNQVGLEMDSEEFYGKVIYEDESGLNIEKIIPTPVGDYGKVYDHLYDAIIKGKRNSFQTKKFLRLWKFWNRNFLEKIHP
jgi:hypothetical protein